MFRKEKQKTEEWRQRLMDTKAQKSCDGLLLSLSWFSNCVIIILLFCKWLLYYTFETWLIYMVICLRCRKSETLYTRNYASLLLVHGTYMCRRVWSLCHSTLALNMSTIAHVARFKPRIHIAPCGTQHFWSDLLKGRCNLPP
jgi:hypothetical protein